MRLPWANTQVASRLWAETSMMLAWIAKNLSMGVPGSGSSLFSVE
jgi:hypothetical protein